MKVEGINVSGCQAWVDTQWDKDDPMYGATYWCDAGWSYHPIDVMKGREQQTMIEQHKEWHQRQERN
jgi:hypothetical protein